MPADIATFVGRERIVADIAAELTGTPRTPGGLVMVSIAGMGGIGKTALAVHIGRQLSSAFPAGQLYLNLRGHSDSDPMSPAEALGRLLRTFGTPPGEIPDDVRTSSARYRAILADRPMLILLDDAASASQVEPLLPGSGGSVVLITSRKRLSGLAGARQVGLDPFSEKEALGLLGSELDPGRIGAEQAAALEIVKLCGRLPLAVRIAGTYLADRPGLTLAQLAGELSDENSRLGMLSAEDIGVRSSIGLSLDGTSPSHGSRRRRRSHPGAPRTTARPVRE